MKKLFYFCLAFLLFNCGPDEPTPEELPEILQDQSLNINATLFGEVASYVYDESLRVDVTDDILSIVSEDGTLDIMISIDEIVDGVVSPSSLSMPRDFSSGPSGQLPECTYYPCTNFSITFSEMDFNQYGVIIATILGKHENNPEEVRIYGDFKLQVD